MVLNAVATDLSAVEPMEGLNNLGTMLHAVAAGIAVQYMVLDAVATDLGSV